MTTEKTFKRDRIPHYDSVTGVGVRVQDARTEAGLSQRALAFPGCSAGYISRIERGERIPSLQVMGLLAEKLDVSVSWLQYGKETIDPRVTMALREISAIANRAGEEIGEIAEAYLRLASAARKAAKDAEGKKK